jgi:hypothetical protein
LIASFRTIGGQSALSSAMQPDLTAVRWATLAILATLMPLEEAQAEIPISLGLVLAVDSSISVDGY